MMGRYIGGEMMAKKVTKIIAEPGKQEFFIEREFDAPRDLVFKAHTDPELYPQWLGPRGFSTKMEEFEPRPGGMWRFVQKDEKGNEYRFHGVYHEVLAPERIIGTFEFDELPEKGHVSLEVSRFEELPGNRTKMVSQSIYMSAADRDGMLQNGMEEGVNEGYERLDELLEKMMVKQH
jgi:uncharacterized protein YndB with AHSA1/START domain